MGAMAYQIQGGSTKLQQQTSNRSMTANFKAVRQPLRAPQERPERQGAAAI